MVARKHLFSCQVGEGLDYLIIFLPKLLEMGCKRYAWRRQFLSHVFNPFDLTKCGYGRHIYGYGYVRKKALHGRVDNKFT